MANKSHYLCNALKAAPPLTVKDCTGTLDRLKREGPPFFCGQKHERCVDYLETANEKKRVG